MALTVKLLEQLHAGDKGRKLKDRDGIYGVVRTRTDGSVSVLFRWRFRHDGKLHDFNCGTWPGETLAEIRKARQWANDQLQGKKNPNIERQLNRQRAVTAQKKEQDAFADDAAKSVRLVAENWRKLDLVKRGTKGRKDNGSEVIRSFEADVFPGIGSTPVHQVSKAACMQILNAVKLRGSLSMANRLLADLSQFFTWCEVQGYIAATPLRTVTKQAVGGAAKIRDRFLTDHELRDLQERLPAAKLQDATTIAIWIMLGTGCRVGEISRARWEHVDTDACIWTIPPENAKNAKEHRIFLSTFVLDQFERLSKITGQSKWCYPAENKADLHVDVRSITKQVHDRQRTKPMKNRSKATGTLLLSGGPWTPHDLRRTAATLMARLKVSPQIIERTLNHVENNKLIKTYQQHDWFEEQQHAWTQLGNHLNWVLQGSITKVIPFPTAASG